MNREHNENFNDITLLSMKQVMKYLNVSQWVYYKLVNSGQLPTVSLGSRKLVRLKSLKKYLESIETRKREVYGGFFN
jgi:excisionase family DNA binding protein